MKKYTTKPALVIHLICLLIVWVLTCHSRFWFADNPADTDLLKANRISQCIDSTLSPDNIVI